MRSFRRLISSLLLVAFVGVVLVPAPAQARNISRTMGGAAGVAAGAMGGFALGSALVSAAGLAALPPVALFMIQGSVVAGCAWVGGKLVSKLGLEMDRMLGPQMTWTIIGASLGTLAALTLFPALGPAFGVMGPFIKVMLGGLVGGVMGRLLGPTLETVATPRTLYGAAGGVVGGLAGGIPGAMAGVAGGYVVGDVLDRGFFADETRDWRSRARDARWKARSEIDRYREARQDVFDWVADRRLAFEDRVRHNWDYYDNYDDSFYCDNDFGGPERDRDVYHTMKIHRPVRQQVNTQAELIELQRDWKKAMRRFEKINAEEDSMAKRHKALREVRRTQSAYQRALREADQY